MTQDPMADAIDVWKQTTDLYLKRWQDQLATLRESTSATGMASEPDRLVTLQEFRQLSDDVDALLSRLDSIDQRLDALVDTSPRRKKKKTKKKHGG